MMDYAVVLAAWFEKYLGLLFLVRTIDSINEKF
jgi:hypothetical protein